jgi:S1-C subfamily serine protease
MSDALKNLSDAMATTVEAISPAIVSVDARRRLPATGVVWSADGVIITTNHVVERDDNIRVMTNDGNTHAAQVVGRDPHNDLALLRVQAASDLIVPTWGDDTALRVGNLVLALGKPGEQVQATLGVVSALVSAEERAERRERRKNMGKRGGPRRRRRMEAMGRMLSDGFVQTDVVMYPGFSGGPLVSGDGAVHGLNTSGFGGGISITIPVTTLRTTAETLLAHGKMQRGYLGTGVQPARLPKLDGLEQETGLLVVSVEDDSPAQQGGVMVGDIIVALDGESTETLDELMASLQSSTVGREISIELVRGGELKQIAVTIGERQ